MEGGRTMDHERRWKVWGGSGQDGEEGSQFMGKQDNTNRVDP